MKINYKSPRLLIISILPIIAIFSFVYFETNNAKKAAAEKVDPKVAGAKAINISDYLGQDLPIIPNAEITSLYSSQDQLNVIIEANQDESQIKNFYEDYFFKNGWQKISKNTFQKDTQKMDLDISGNLIKLRIFK